MALAHELDQMIRQGRMGKAKLTLINLKMGHIPRQEVADLADIARRLNMAKWMVAVLKPIVHPEQELHTPASIRERALYSTGISRLGVFSEARELLDKLDGKAHPQVYFFHAQNSMLQWDVTSAIPMLNHYLHSEQISDYEWLVGAINLAASHIWDMDWLRGQNVLDQIWNRIEKEKFSPALQLIRSYATQLAAEMSIQMGQYGKARELVNLAQRDLHGTRSHYEFYARKWHAILEALVTPQSSENLTELRAIKSEAKKRDEWETARDCVLFEALALRDDRLFLLAYNGTPYSSFRLRAKSLYQPKMILAQTIHWCPGHDDHPLGHQGFDVVQGCDVIGKSDLAHAPLLHALLRILSRDFFRPVALGTLVSELYPHEYYNPHSSPQKALQIVSRLRHWFKASSIPMSIEAYKESFRLVGPPDYWLKITRGKKNQRATQLAKPKLLVWFGRKPFTGRQVQSQLGLSARSTQRLISDSVRRGDIIRIAHGRSSSYRIK